MRIMWLPLTDLLLVCLLLVALSLLIKSVAFPALTSSLPEQRSVTPSSRPPSLASTQNTRKKRRARRHLPQLAKRLLRHDEGSKASSTSGMVRTSSTRSSVSSVSSLSSSERSQSLENGFKSLELQTLLHAFPQLFAGFDQSMFQQLCKSLQRLDVPAGHFLFRVNDPDDQIHVVISGKLNVLVDEEKSAAGSTRVAKYSVMSSVRSGQSVTSLLSFVDVMTGKQGKLKTVACKAVVRTALLKLPVRAICEILDGQPEKKMRVLQLIMARVQRVTLTTLHSYLGLTSELIRDTSASDQPDHNESTVSYKDGLEDDTAMSVEQAVCGFQQILQLNEKNVQLLRDSVELCSKQSTESVMTEDSYEDSKFVLVLKGALSIRQKQNLNVSLVIAREGECVGHLAMVTGEPNFYSCVAITDSMLATIDKDTFELLALEQPEIITRLSEIVVSQMSPLVRKVDFALDWIHLLSGETLFKEGEPCDGLYIILNGRLRVVRGSKRDVIRGDVIGLTDALSDKSIRAETAVATRDSELCRVPVHLIYMLKQTFPVVLASLINLMGHNILHSLGCSVVHPLKNNGREEVFTEPNHSRQMSYSSVALYSSQPRRCIIDKFGQALSTSLKRSHQSVARVSSDLVLNTLGPDSLRPEKEFKLNTWISQMEGRHKVVIYQCDDIMSRWTRRCLRQADLVLDLVLVDDEDNPDYELTAAEKALKCIGHRVRKELVLIHKQHVVCPKNTKSWLEPRRDWVQDHFHVKASRSFFNAAASTPENVKGTLAIHSDFDRLARHITGTSMGLVLGGGGARGASHVGLLKAILETGIPVDRIGGTSIGAFVGGLYAGVCNRRIEGVRAKTSVLFDGLGSSVLQPALDLTYPHTSYFAGDYFNSLLIKAFGESVCIEDLWLPYFCVTTDISASTQRVHTKGNLWRYVRASMTYGSLIPPMCDPVDGHLLVDGCYVNNVPADTQIVGTKSIIAIDVTPEDRSKARVDLDYGDALSGWWWLWRRFVDWATFSNPQRKVPDVAELQFRLSYCHHYEQLALLKTDPDTEYIRPPMECYTARDFKKFDEIFNVGYIHGSTLFTGLRRAHESNATLTKARETWSVRSSSYSTRRRMSSNSSAFEIANSVILANRQDAEDGSDDTGITIG